MPRFQRWRIPDVIASIQIPHLRSDKLLGRHIIQARNNHCDKFPDPRRLARRMCMNPASLAKEVPVALGQEAILAQSVVAEQPER